MADELQVSIRATLVNGNLRAEFNPGTVKVTQASLGAHAPVVSVTTAGVTVSDGDVSTLGWAYFRNLSTGNYVTIGPENTLTALQPFIRLEPGEPAAMRLSPGIVIRALADTTNVLLQTLILED